MTLYGKYTKDEYRALAAEWNRKLEAEGISELEPSLDNGTPGRLHVGRRLRTEHGSAFQRNGGETAAYYILAGQFLHSHKFESPEDRRVWKMHSEGSSVRAIAKKFGRSTKWAFTRVRRSREAMLGETSRPD